MQIFIDTNIFLDYLEGGDAYPHRLIDDLEKLISTNNFNLLLTNQIIDEYNRNKNIIKNKKINSIKSPIEFPKNISSIGLVDEDNLSKLDKDIKKFIKKCKKMMKGQKQKIKEAKDDLEKRDKKIKEFFEKQNIIKDNYDIIKKAEIRYLKGNPPRKESERKNSYGDAINWEIILEHGNKKKPITIIANDKDYCDILYDKKCLNNLLNTDWKNISKNKIYFFDNLAEFINKHLDKTIVKKDVIEHAREEKEIGEYLLKNRVDWSNVYLKNSYDAVHDILTNISNPIIDIDKKTSLQILGSYVKNIISQLSPREQKILEMRFGLIDGIPHTLEEVGKEFEITRERVRQIESKALEKIKKFNGLEKLKDF